MIHFMSRHFYEIHRYRQHWQDKLDKRRTFLLTLSLFTVVAVGVLAWILR